MKTCLQACLVICLVISFGGCQFAPSYSGQLHGSTVGLKRIACIGLKPEPEMEKSIKAEDLEEMNQILIDYLIKKDYLPIPPAQLNGTRAAVLSSQTDLAPVRLLQAVGKAHQAQALLVGQLYRYREKMTKGENPPASVGMILELIRVDDGTTLWRARYDETQKTVLENLLGVSSLFKRGLRWPRPRNWLSMD